MTSSIFLFEISNVATLDPNTFLCILASADHSAGVNPDGVKTFLANGPGTVFIKGKPVFSNGCKSLPRNRHDSSILDSWVFDNFILADELLVRTC